MEEFAQIAREHFELNQKFVAVSQHRTTSITATTSGDTSYVSEYLETEELDKGAFFQTEPLNAKREGRVLASLRLVVVMQAIHDTNEPDAPILMSKDLFL